MICDSQILSIHRIHYSEPDDSLYRGSIGALWGKIGESLDFSCFLLFFVMAFMGFRYFKMADSSFLTYSNICWIIFGFSKKWTEYGPSDPLFGHTFGRSKNGPKSIGMHPKSLISYFGIKPQKPQTYITKKTKKTPKMFAVFWINCYELIVIARSSVSFGN